jgi:hypothetical protein
VLATSPAASCRSLYEHGLQVILLQPSQPAQRMPQSCTSRRLRISPALPCSSYSCFVTAQRAKFSRAQRDVSGWLNSRWMATYVVLDGLEAEEKMRYSAGEGSGERATCDPGRTLC